MDNPEIDQDGHKRWWAYDRLHRTDGPAIEWLDGCKSWWINGIRHRTDGPAVEFTDGDMWWYMHGQGYSFDNWLELNPDLTDGEKLMMKLQYG
jgi:hypothetical protein